MKKLFAGVAATALFAGVAFAGEAPVEADAIETEAAYEETTEVEIEAEGDAEAEIVKTYAEPEEDEGEEEETEEEDAE